MSMVIGQTIIPCSHGLDTNLIFVSHYYYQ